MEAAPIAAAVAVLEEETPGLVLASTSVEEVKSPMADEPKLLVEDIESFVEKVNPPIKEVKPPIEEVKPVESAEVPLPKPEISEPKEEDSVSSSTPAKPETPETDEAVEEEAVVSALHLSGFFFSLEDKLPATLLDLIYWRQPVISGGVFFSLFFLLLAFSVFSAISVVSHLAMVVLAVTLSYVGFRKVAAAVQKSDEGHPFQVTLDQDVEALLRVDDVQDVIQALIGHVLNLLGVLRSLFLIANVFDSFKLGLFLYGITYVGDAFNLLTIVIIALVVLFTVPKTYEIYGADIDLVAEKLMAQARAQWPVIKEQVVDRIMMIKEKAIAAIPAGKEKAA